MACCDVVARAMDFEIVTSASGISNDNRRRGVRVGNDFRKSMRHRRGGDHASTNCGA